MCTNEQQVLSHNNDGMDIRGKGGARSGKTRCTAVSYCNGVRVLQLSLAPPPHTHPIRANPDPGPLWPSAAVVTFLHRGPTSHIGRPLRRAI